MTTAWKPTGYTSVAPYLLTNDAPGVIAFAEAAFGAELLKRFDHDDHGVVHAEVRIDDSVVMMGSAGEGSPAVPSHIHVYVPDVKATFAAALAAGGEAVAEPVQRDDPDMRGGVKDPGGNTWWVSTRVE